MLIDIAAYGIARSTADRPIQIAIDNPLYVSGIEFDSTISIDGPETDMFNVTDNMVTLVFNVRGRYEFEVAGNRSCFRFQRALEIV